jgi:carboxypeptidase C (cathepsin A)
MTDTENTDKTPATPAPRKEPQERIVVTEHSRVVGGKTLDYTATCGTVVLRDYDDKDDAKDGKSRGDKARATIFFTAYTRKGAGSADERPLTFSFNGGPGSSSVWLHLGILGPHRVATDDKGNAPPPPYALVDNELTLLEESDLVFIDPVGTGFSRVAEGEKVDEFHEYQRDLDAVGEFIRFYLARYGRWGSPKYLIGESYGTTRSAGVVDWLQVKGGMGFNGVVLVSVAIDLGAIFALPGNDQPYPLYLPSYAAAAWYHKILPNRPAELEPWLTEVRRWAASEFADALAEGARLPDDRRAAVVKKLHDYTGLSEEYLRLADLRVSESEFTQELLREKGITIGRLDSRFVGPTVDPLAKEAESDPQSDAITDAYTAALFDWLHDGLKFGDGKTYVVSAPAWKTWDFKHEQPGLPFPSPTLTNTGLDLGRAMIYNPNLRVLVLNGYFDLATPFFATEYQIAHISPHKEVQPRIEMKYYPAGHMMYVAEPSLKAMKSDIADLIAKTSK